MSNEIIVTDLQSPSIPDAYVELYELDLGDGVKLFFHPGTDTDLGNIKFHPYGDPAANTEEGANEYIPLPLMLDGIETTSDGASNRPSITIANVSTLFRAALNNEGFSFEEIVGQRLTRRTTFANYLVGGADALAPYEFPRATYIIDRIAAENQTAVTFELAAPFDVSGIKLPNRAVLGKYCSWIYQGLSNGLGQGGCLWAANSTVIYDGVEYEAFFTRDDEPLVDQTLFDAAATAWVSGTYNPSDYVTFAGKKYRAEAVTSESPGGNEFWIEVFTYTTWSSVTAYTTGVYVKHTNHIWKALKNSTDQEPNTSSISWTRVDYCGKTLESCKSRFQFVPVSGGLPAATLETDRTLPFGGYPGSAKFK